ncbi:MAG: sigma-70 family RNA polymerase sigma factor [Acidobacteria bacterium]|nr:sigma-70 family RNA polymerase sigma factor [Acidobacteriota bacterium]
MKKNWKDADMVEGLRAGDARALEAVMEKYQGKVYNTAIGIVKNPSDAQEVVQDVFVTLYRKADTFKGNSSLFTWIYRITVNFGFMKIRSRRKEPHIPIEEATRMDADEAVLTTILPDKRCAADDLVIQRELMGKVLQFTRELPDKYRRVFMLRDVQNYSNEEVGRLLNLSVAAVKSRIHRARSYIRERISGFQTAEMVS